MTLEELNNCIKVPEAIFKIPLQRLSAVPYGLQPRIHESLGASQTLFEAEIQRPELKKSRSPSERVTSKSPKHCLVFIRQEEEEKKLQRS